MYYLIPIYYVNYKKLLVYIKVLRILCKIPTITSIPTYNKKLQVHVLVICKLLKLWILDCSQSEKSLLQHTKLKPPALCYL